MMSSSSARSSGSDDYRQKKTPSTTAQDSPIKGDEAKLAQKKQAKAAERAFYSLSFFRVFEHARHLRSLNEIQQGMA